MDELRWNVVEIESRSDGCAAATVFGHSHICRDVRAYMTERSTCSGYSQWAEKF